MLGIWIDFENLKKFLNEIIWNSSISSILVRVTNIQLINGLFFNYLSYLSDSSIEIQGVSELPQKIMKNKEGVEIHGTIHVIHNNKSGLVKINQQYYSLNQGVVQFFDILSEEELRPEIVAKSEIQNESDKNEQLKQQQNQEQTQNNDKHQYETQLMSSMEGGMKLSLSQKEASAKAQVVLPYEHGGAGSAFKTHDFKDYLPEAAGGNVSQTKLGQIHYLRDSEGEFDSDEDPDDDLDI
eukprot:TRINITY_DN12543_c2_g1_i1.p1 TRINITY_DN12543_c2_g1~~TRINITY_DN12543_c2_g1_i1.p1  ORF type:complete len:278 (+),score=54.15 TRINITY_DN12543_c2_g1_i1:119-835(+)